jgi:hypothetical protein
LLPNRAVSLFKPAAIETEDGPSRANILDRGGMKTIAAQITCSGAVTTASVATEVAVQNGGDVRGFAFLG